MCSIVITYNNEMKHNYISSVQKRELNQKEVNTFFPSCIRTNPSCSISKSSVHFVTSYLPSFRNHTKVKFNAKNT
jgi:hypothetical protein